MVITFHHDDDDEKYIAAIFIRSRFEKIIDLIQTLDPKVEVNPVWNEADSPPPLVKGNNLPEKWIQLHIYIYIYILLIHKHLDPDI
jgi:hypothetical protein